MSPEKLKGAVMELQNVFHQAFRPFTRTGGMFLRAVKSGYRELGYVEKIFIAIGVIAGVTLCVVYFRDDN